MYYARRFCNNIKCANETNTHAHRVPLAHRICSTGIKAPRCLLLLFASFISHCKYKNLMYRIHISNEIESHELMSLFIGSFCLPVLSSISFAAHRKTLTTYPSQLSILFCHFLQLSLVLTLCIVRVSQAYVIYCNRRPTIS